MAIAEIHDRIVDALSKGLWCCGIFLDLSKAFDTLGHKILLHKLYLSGIRGKAYEWINSYLSNRKQITALPEDLNRTNKPKQHFNRLISANGKEVYSTEKNCKCGVPQGSVLGPILFLIYINDLPKNIKIATPLLFADDTNLLFKNKNLENLEMSINQELKIINDWFRANKLSLNANKTKYILFHTKQKAKSITPINLILSETSIERVQTTKFLGIALNENLSWEPHINTVASKIGYALYHMYRLKHELPTSTLKLLYHGLIHPHLTYGLLTWGSCSITNKQQFERLEILQKKAVRMITGASFLDHSEPLFSKMGILKLKDLFALQCVKLYGQVRHGKCPPYHSQNLIQQSHSRTMRNEYNLFIKSVKLTLSKESINYKVSTIWNKLPNHIKNINTYQSSMKQQLVKTSQYFFSQYQSSPQCSLYPNCYSCGRHQISSFS